MVAQQGADVCVRVNPRSLPLWSQPGQRFPLRQKLKTVTTGQGRAWPVKVKWKDQWISGRLCVIRKSKEAIAKADRKLRRNQQQGRTGEPTAETREYVRFILVFTTIPETLATAHQILEWYRRRWQIELTFKHLKSIVQLGHVPKQDDRSSRAWLYGKLLVALLSQKLIKVGSSISPWGYILSEETADPKPRA